jgi:hypothetical protein
LGVALIYTAACFFAFGFVQRSVKCIPQCSLQVMIVSSLYPRVMVSPAAAAAAAAGSDLASCLTRAIQQSYHVVQEQYLAEARELLASHDRLAPPVVVGQPLPLDAAFYQRYQEGKVKVRRTADVGCATCWLLFIWFLKKKKKRGYTGVFKRLWFRRRGVTLVCSSGFGFFCERRGVTLVCSSGYAATDTWNTRKLRTAQLRLSLLRLNPKKSPCVSLLYGRAPRICAYLDILTS